MKTTLTEIGISLTVGLIAILFTVVVPYKTARSKYRRDLGF